MDSPQQLLLWCPHCGGPLDNPRIISWGGWTFDEDQSAFVTGTPGASIRFTTQEANIIGTLLRRGGQVCDKEGALFSAICANRPECDWPEFKIVDVIICKIRKKFREANLIFIGTVWGRGYNAVEYDPNPVFEPLRERKIRAVPFFSRLAKPCLCGHIKTNHKHSSDRRRIAKTSGKLTYHTGRCSVEGCTCDKYRSKT